MLDHMMSIQLHRIMGSVAACGRVFVLMCDHWEALRLRRSRAKSLPPALKSLKRDYVPQQSWFLPALVLQQKQGGADFGTCARSYVCFRFWPVWHHPHRARPVEKTGCQTFLQRSTQDPAPACERSLDPPLSGKVQTLFRRTDADEEHGERSLLLNSIFDLFQTAFDKSAWFFFKIPWVGHRKALLN